MLSHHLHPNKLLEAIKGNYLVHCVQTLPSNGSEMISRQPFWCCFIFCLFLLHLGQSVEKMKGDESMKLSFGFSEAGAVYFTSKGLFHLFIYFYSKRNWDSLEHFRLGTPAYFVPQYGFSASEKVRFFSLLQWTASKRDRHPWCGPKSLHVRSSFTVPLEQGTKPSTSQGLGSDSEIQGQTPSSHSAEVIPCSVEKCIRRKTGFILFISTNHGRMLFFSRP